MEFVPAYIAQVNSLVQRLIEVFSEKVPESLGSVGSDAALAYAQHVVAGLMGHATWDGLASSIGTLPAGPYDDELDDAAWDARRRRQTRILQMAGFRGPRSVANVLRELNPTSGLGVRALRPLAGGAAPSCHPNRVRSVFRQLMSLPEFDGSVECAYELLAEHPHGAATVLDRWVFEDEAPDFHPLSHGLDFLEGVGLVLDGSDVAREFRPDGRPNFGFVTRFFRETPLHNYVQFGPKGLPSPYPGLEIDGAYVEVEFDYAEMRTSNHFCFTLAMPDELEGKLPPTLEALRSVVRGHSVSIVYDRTDSSGLPYVETNGNFEWEPYYETAVELASKIMSVHLERASFTVPRHMTYAYGGPQRLPGSQSGMRLPEPSGFDDFIPCHKVEAIDREEQEVPRRSRARTSVF